jgi:hypothetical protein
MKRTNRMLMTSLVVLLLASTMMAGCSGTEASQHADHPFDLAPLSDMPGEVQQAPVAVQEAYQFAVANPEVLEQIPCYCGCGAMDHTSNYACFVADTGTDGEVVYDNHALGCSICVDITQDTMRLLDQGKEIPEIFAFVDRAYARFGPPTSLE